MGWHRRRPAVVIRRGRAHSLSLRRLQGELVHGVARGGCCQANPDSTRSTCLPLRSVTGRRQGVALESGERFSQGAGGRCPARVQAVGTVVRLPAGTRSPTPPAGHGAPKKSGRWASRWRRPCPRGPPSCSSKAPTRPRLYPHDMGRDTPTRGDEHTGPPARAEREPDEAMGFFRAAHRCATGRLGSGVARRRPGSDTRPRKSRPHRLLRSSTDLEQGGAD